MVAADAKTAVTSLSPDQAGGATEGRRLLKTLENQGWDGAHVIMDKAYEGNEICQLVLELEMLSVVLPKSNRLSLGKMTERCTRNGTRSNDFFDA